jgi:uncharacterized protein (DUF1499 family)
MERPYHAIWFQISISKDENMKRNFIALVSIPMLIGLSACAGTPPTDLGVSNGQLTPCPSSPNCVSSQAVVDDERHFIDALAYSREKEDIFNALVKEIQAQQRTKITRLEGNYIRAEFSSAVFGFVDDVEFYFPEESLIHVRSASRKGKSDFGANRKRIELIRENIVSDLR